MRCPECGGGRVNKNGFTRQGKQNYKCRGCGRQFVLEPEARVSLEVKGIVRRMLDQGHPVREIHEITRVSKSWIYGIRCSGPEGLYDHNSNFCPWCGDPIDMCDAFGPCPERLKDVELAEEADG